MSGGGASLALPGPFISKMEAGSLREQWHTPLSNNNVTGAWLISDAMNFPVADGTIAVVQGQYLYKVSVAYLRIITGCLLQWAESYSR